MILYHGSNVEIDTIDFNKSKVGKDFGVGFYLSAEEQQAQEMAEKKTQLFGGKPTITRYEFNEEAAKADAEIQEVLEFTFEKNDINKDLNIESIVNLMIKYCIIIL